MTDWTIELTRAQLDGVFWEADVYSCLQPAHWSWVSASPVLSFLAVSSSSWSQAPNRLWMEGTRGWTFWIQKKCDTKEAFVCYTLKTKYECLHLPHHHHHQPTSFFPERLNISHYLSIQKWLGRMQGTPMEQMVPLGWAGPLCLLVSPWSAWVTSNLWTAPVVCPSRNPSVSSGLHQKQYADIMYCFNWCWTPCSCCFEGSIWEQKGLGAKEGSLGLPASSIHKSQV